MTLTVTELTQQIKAHLEPRFRAMQVQGEVSNFKQQSSGHLYFSLKDAGAQISAALFRGNAAALKRLPKDGDQVIAIGDVGLYAPRGQYQLIVRELQFAGVGALLLQFQALKEELQKRGWFALERKRPLPKLPRCIGVITSPTGAAIRDIIHVISRRFSGVRVILNPVKVQGEGAAEEIAQAIADCNRHHLADVLIVGRGGGSIEDLWAFNEEIVARAMVESEIPIISAVGHETDVTIADWVADVRAPTPSAAAEMVVAEKAHLLQQLVALRRHPLFSSPYALLSTPIQRLDSARSRLALLNPVAQIARHRQTLSPTIERLPRAFRTLLETQRRRLDALRQHLLSLHPKHLLRKGYSLLFTEEDALISSATQVQPHQPIKAITHEGTIRATVTHTLL